MSPKHLVSLGSALSCFTKTLFGSLRLYWPPHPAHHQLALCFPFRCNPQASIGDNEGTRTTDSVTPPCPSTFFAEMLFPSSPLPPSLSPSPPLTPTTHPPTHTPHTTHPHPHPHPPTHPSHPLSKKLGSFRPSQHRHMYLHVFAFFAHIKSNLNLI